MKIKQETIDILQNFAQINNSIYVDESGYLKTKTPNSSNIIGVAKIEDELPTFAIYHLSEFLSVLSLFDQDIKYKFTNDYINISDKKVKIKYRLSDPKLIFSQCKSAADYEAYNTFDFNLKLTEEQIDKTLKAARILSANIISFECKDKICKVSLFNSDTPLNNSFEIEVESTGEGEVKFFVDNLLIVPGDYTINVTSNKVIKFENTNNPIFYFISAAVI